MNHSKRTPISTAILSGLLLLFAASCTAMKTPPTLGILTSNPATPSVAAEQQAGYLLRLESFGFTLNEQVESTTQDELQKTVRNMVEDRDGRVTAIIGASSNEASARTAALVNFFNVPMIIPTASGDNLMPSNNLWAFQLSAPGSAYADHLFGQVLTQNAINSLNIEPENLKDFKIAILYEQNTFGETAAVAAAKQAMAQIVEIDPEQSLYGMEIAVYGSFPDQNPDSERLNNLANQVKDSKAQLVYLITSEPAIAQKLVQAFRAQFAADETPLPIFIGQSGGFASEAFTQTAEAGDVYILRQKWNRDRCPEGITTPYAGQAYGALYLLDNAIGVASETMPKRTFTFDSESAQDEELATLREKVRDALKQSRLDVPCLGTVSFDNTGQNKELNFELVLYKNNFERLISNAEFLEALKQRILETPPFQP